MGNTKIALTVILFAILTFLNSKALATVDYLTVNHFTHELYLADDDNSIGWIGWEAIPDGLTERKERYYLAKDYSFTQNPFKLELFVGSILVLLSVLFVWWKRIRINDAERASVISKRYLWVALTATALALSVYSIHAQKRNGEISKEVSEIVALMIEDNILRHEYTGYSGSTSDQYSNFQKLCRIATQEELLVLLMHKNSVVKGYASWALIHQKYPDLNGVFSIFLTSGESADSQSGCIISRSSLATEFYYQVVWKAHDSYLPKADQSFFKDQLQKLDNTLLYSEKEYHLLEKALRNNQANPINYQIIRKWALEKGNADALIELAKYKQDADIQFIKHKRKNAFPAIVHFPHPEFWDFLMKYRGKVQTQEYYSAIAAYKNEESADLLKELYNEIKSDLLAAKPFYKALAEHYDEIYQPHFYKIFEQTGMLDITVAKKLIAENPETCAQIFSDRLLSGEGTWLLELGYNYGTKDSVLMLMLENIQSYETDKLLEICINHIKIAESQELEIYLDFTRENKMVDASSTILERLKQDNIAYEMFHLTETFLSLGNVDQKDEIKSILKEKQEDWDWVNWSSHFRKMLAEYQIYL